MLEASDEGDIAAQDQPVEVRNSEGAAEELDIVE
eukprot:CAMPEP_0170473732 /NCGR_PEP_ID=MMETSP0123-20130129/15598_1 /TAXON_ID=182087 /ORGANISM="Favella ehrenbergii, Strain Fehren 1" /LENGTH=33 /DNA_ID= /DNA_START= /DNA_END= /DNA_ORIENTATION=